MLVLPTLPVIPTTVAASRSRAHAASVHQRGRRCRRPRSTGIAVATGRRGQRRGRRRRRRRRRRSRARRARRRAARTARPGAASGSRTRRRRARRRARAACRRWPRPRRMPGSSSRRTVPSTPHAPHDRIHLVVLFGGQSAEHDVSCVTADPRARRRRPGALPDHADRHLTEGEWALAERRPGGARRRAGGAAGAARSDRQSVDRPDAVAGRRRCPASARSCCRCCTARWARTARCRACSSWPTWPTSGAGVLGSALAMDKAMAKQVLAANGIPQARYRAFAEHERTPGLPDELVAELGLPCFVKPANMGSSVGVTQGPHRRGAARRHRPRPDLRRVGRRRGGRRRPRDRGRRARQHRPAGVGPGEIVPGAEFYDYEDKYVTDGAQLLIPAPLTRRADRRGAGAGRARVRGAALRRPGPRRLLLRGGRPRLPVQRGQHDARLHADLDVPEAVAGRRRSATPS